MGAAEAVPKLGGELGGNIRAVSALGILGIWCGLSMFHVIVLLVREPEAHKLYISNSSKLRGGILFIERWRQSAS